MTLATHTCVATSPSQRTPGQLQKSPLDADHSGRASEPLMKLSLNIKNSVASLSASSQRERELSKHMKHSQPASKTLSSIDPCTTLMFACSAAIISSLAEACRSLFNKFHKFTQIASIRCTGISHVSLSGSSWHSRCLRNWGHVTLDAAHSSVCLCWIKSRPSASAIPAIPFSRTNAAESCFTPCSKWTLPTCTLCRFLAYNSHVMGAATITFS